MSKYETILVSRSEFVDKRYQRFLETKKKLTDLGLPSESYVLTDLDRIYDGYSKKMKDVVICDRCNEDIEEETVLMVERSLMYHKECGRNFIPEAEPVIKSGKIENVIFVDFKREVDE